jgi:hypothetical protein
VEVDVFSLAAEFPNDNPALHRGTIWVCQSTIGPAVAELAPPLEREPITIVTVEPTPIVLVGGEERAEREEAPSAVAEPEPVADVAPAEAVEAEPIVAEPPPRPSGIIAVGERDELDFEIESELDLEDRGASLVEVAASAPDEDEGEDAIVVEELEPLDASATVEEVVAEAVSAAPATTLPPAPDDPFTMLLTTLTDVALACDAAHAAAMLPSLLVDGVLSHAPPPEVAAALASGGVARGGAATPEFVATTHAWRDILRGTSEDFGACGAMMLDEWCADLLARLLGAPDRSSTLRRELRARGVAAFGLANAA